MQEETQGRKLFIRKKIKDILVESDAVESPGRNSNSQAKMEKQL